jgi:hypothetical protein
VHLRKEQTVIPYIEATHVESGSFAAGDEDTFNAGIERGETVIICKVEFFKQLLDAYEKTTAMKPDGHYWDHTSKTYRDMVEPKEGPPRAS